MASAAPSMPCHATRAAMRRDMLAWLHGKGSVGRVWIGQKTIEEDGTERFEGQTIDAADVVTTSHPEDVQYASVNRFWGRSRASDFMKACGTIPFDWDFHTPGLPFADREPEDVAGMIVEAFEAIGLPAPTLWFSGRGIQGALACHGVKTKALARVRSCLQHLHGTMRRRRNDTEFDAWAERMRPFWLLMGQLGLDPSCVDGARVIRLVGSINPKSGKLARLLHPSSFDDAQVHIFHDLAEAILPVTRAVLAERRAAREAQGIVGGEKARRLPTSFWPGVLSDLMRLRDHRGGISVGQRDTWLFLAANAFAHVRGGDRDQWVAELAPLAGLSEKEARAALSTLDRRQRRAEAGDTDTYDGRERSPLYGYSARRMIELLGITDAEAEAAGLRKLTPAGSTAKTDAERQADRRRRAGSVAREDAIEARAQDGHVALGLRADGWTLAEIGASLGRSRTSLLRAMREAEAERQAGIGIERPAPVVVLVSETTEAVHTSSRSIVAKACAPGERARAGEPVAPGEVRVTRWTVQFAVVETATGTWEWHRYRETRFGAASWDTIWDRTSVGAPLPSDQLLAEAARRDLEAGVAAPATVARRPGRASADRRPGGSQRLRRTGFRSLTPLDVDHRATLYRLASQGA